MGSNQPVAIVTGISKGFGEAVARDLCQAGWHVVGNARHADALMQAASGIGSPTQLTPVPGDVTDEAHLQALVDAALSAGDLTLVVNNAAILAPSPLPPSNELDTGVLAELFAVNVIAPLRLIQIAMERATPSVIINLASKAAIPAINWGGYGVSKLALEHLTIVLGLENPGTRFYALDPGGLRTEMLQSGFPEDDISHWPLPERRAAMVRELATRRPKSGRYVAEDLRELLVG